MSRLSESGHWTLRVAVSIVSVALLLICVCLRISANDHAAILRDQRIKVACVQSGQSIIGGSCVRVTK